jgi:deoxyribonuclease IV
VWVRGGNALKTHANSILSVAVRPQVGVHVSIAGSLESAFGEATSLGCTSFQIFTRSPRVWAWKPLADEAVAAFLQKRKETNFKSLVVHMPYLPNLATPIKQIMKQSRASLKEEVGRCNSLGIEFLIVHLGSHMGKGTMTGVRNVAAACDLALSSNPGRATILLENMAGQKNCVGARFEELRSIIDLVGENRRVGVCLDTCHLFASGFDLSSEEGVESTLGLFKDVVGYERLKVVHLNDSKGSLGSNLDRHEHVGMGMIGPKGFRAFVRYKGIVERPLILENPIDDKRGQKDDLRFVMRMLK